ncbi:hypothetical protein LJ753_09970 [Arthrobacter sp. zg-Y20]|uniref:ABC-three component system protein n=1 Tax=unclassified Arthrobacter TaxID=235627 RepID=UPI001D135534|nr:MULTISPECIES: ABC-three component system protein [unclassified Arthrobacter]MCC3276195.1 hypothetical protein [Arthrobacter sp. zg-Y20]MDK1316355.1 hypothetical protein [Arthrobacter sp. zg.Y20]WIB06404.1 hypothetical protein QNO06_01285 [Arthrobacter sp. zg-Y20]
MPHNEIGGLMPRNYSPLTLKQLFLTSGHYCAFPECTSAIVHFTDSGPVVLGEIAHIEGSSDDGPRPNPSLSSSSRDGYGNLVILCAHHHNLVDKIDSAYPVETLQEWKRAAEQATAERLSIGATSVSFAELQIVCNAFADGDIDLPSTPMIAVPPQEKMDANGLTEAIRPTMTIGLAQAPQAADFIRRQAQLSSRFPARIRAGFVQEYDRLHSKGRVGDELFLSLLDFGANSAVSPQTDLSRMFVIRAAAAAVLCHLFEVCDVFEPPA